MIYQIAFIIENKIIKILPRLIVGFNFGLAAGDAVIDTSESMEYNLYELNWIFKMLVYLFLVNGSVTNSVSDLLKAKKILTQTYILYSIIRPEMGKIAHNLHCLTSATLPLL